MCGKYGGPTEMAVHAGYLKVEAPFKHLKSEDPRLAMKTVDLWARNSQGVHVLKEMEWGLIPSRFSAAPELCDKRLTHARIETAHQLESFREPWRRKWRCLFSMDAFHQKVKPNSDLLGRGTKNAKLAITRSDAQPLGVAGIYNAIKTETGVRLTAAMLTREPGPRMFKIHEREPVIVEPKDFIAWLDGAENLDLNSPWADDAFDYKLVA
jgi:putative SOS response-associated peptidase YedK